MSECHREASKMRRLWPTRGCQAVEKNIYISKTQNEAYKYYTICVTRGKPSSNCFFSNSYRNVFSVPLLNFLVPVTALLMGGGGGVG